MDSYLEDLFSHMKSVDVLHNECYAYDIGSIIAVLFNDDSGVEQLMYYKDEDYCGVAIVVYQYKGKFFCLKEEFGSCSGCDEWDSNSYDNHARTVEWFKKDIAASVVDHIYEVTLPFEPYLHPDIRHEWEQVLNKYGDGLYDRCLALAEERIMLREEERDKEQKEFEAMEANKLVERLVNEQLQLRALREKRDADILQDVTDVMTYLEQNTIETDPFFAKKARIKVRLLKFHLNDINESLRSKAKDLILKFSS